MIPLSAGVYYNGNYYVTCDTCITNSDFEASARGIFLFKSRNNLDVSTQVDFIFLKPSRLQYFNLENITVSNLDSFLTIVEVNSQASPRDYFPTITGSAVPLSSLSTSRKNELVTQLRNYKNQLALAEEHIDRHGLEPFKATTGWSTLLIGPIFMSYEGNTHLIDRIKGMANLRLSAINFNPFHFADKPLTVELDTADGYTFIFIQDKMGPETSLSLFAIEEKITNRHALFTDASGSILKQSTLPESAVCVFNGSREICRSVNPFSHLVYGNRTTIFYKERCSTPPCPSPDAPTSCPNGSSQYCRGQSTPPTPIFSIAPSSL